MGLLSVISKLIDLSSSKREKQDSLQQIISENMETIRKKYESARLVTSLWEKSKNQTLNASWNPNEINNPHSLRRPHQRKTTSLLNPSLYCRFRPLLFLTEHYLFVFRIPTLILSKALSAQPPLKIHLIKPHTSDIHMPKQMCNFHNFSNYPTYPRTKRFRINKITKFA